MASTTYTEVSSFSINGERPVMPESNCMVDSIGWLGSLGQSIVDGGSSIFSSITTLGGLVGKNGSETKKASHYDDEESDSESPVRETQSCIDAPSNGHTNGKKYHIDTSSSIGENSTYLVATPSKRNSTPHVKNKAIRSNTQKPRNASVAYVNGVGNVEESKYLPNGEINGEKSLSRNLSESNIAAENGKHPRNGNVNGTRKMRDLAGAAELSKQIISSYYDALNKKDIFTAVSYLDDNVLVRFPEENRNWEGAATALKKFKFMFNKLPGFHGTLHFLDVSHQRGATAVRARCEFICTITGYKSVRDMVYVVDSRKSKILLIEHRL
jgi:ketosteroid isomerase-like protein